MRLHQWWMRWPRREVRYPDIPAISRHAIGGAAPSHCWLQRPMSHATHLPLSPSRESCTPCLGCLSPLAETCHRRFPLVLDEIMIDHYRSEEHTSELQSLMRISYAVFCLKTNK